MFKFIAGLVVAAVVLIVWDEIKNGGTALNDALKGFQS